MSDGTGTDKPLEPDEVLTPEEAAARAKAKTEAQAQAKATTSNFDTMPTESLFKRGLGALAGDLLARVVGGNRAAGRRIGAAVADPEVRTKYREMLGELGERLARAAKLKGSK